MRPLSGFTATMSIFPGRLFRHFNLGAFTAPRRPRHPLLRALVGVLGVALLLALLVVGVFVGAAMLLGGALWRALTARRSAPAWAGHGGCIDGSYRVVDKAHLPAAH